MISLGKMIERIASLHGTDDLNAWETEFVESIAKRTNNGSYTAQLSDKQIDRVEQLFKKHFGD